MTRDKHTSGRFFAGIRDVAGGGESVHPLLDAGNVRIERIVSRGHASPEDFWYDQPNDEWVMVLRGRGAVELAAAGDAEEARVVELGPGDYLHIPAHRRHRVAWTAEDEPTVWLAVHYLTLHPKVRPELSGPPPRG